MFGVFDGDRVGILSDEDKNMEVSGFATKGELQTEG